MAVTDFIEAVAEINQDLFEAFQSVSYVKTTLQQWREGSHADGDHWESSPYGAFFAVRQLAETLDVDISLPRLVGKQTTRNNVPATSPSEYYQRAIWFPYLDAILQAINEKCSHHQLTILKMAALVPSVIESCTWNDVPWNDLLGNVPI